MQSTLNSEIETLVTIKHSEMYLSTSTKTFLSIMGDLVKAEKAATKKLNRSIINCKSSTVNRSLERYKLSGHFHNIASDTTP